jgi:outer membrane protein assembly factor BamB
LIYRRLLSIIMIFLLSGCASSLIRTTVHKDEDAYTGFGRNPGREFFIDKNITDSVSLKWQNDVHGSFTNSSVVVYDSLVFVSDLSGRIYCFNIVNGDNIGQLKNSGSIFSTPCINKFYIIYASADDADNITHLIYYDYVLGEKRYEAEAEGRCVTEIIGMTDGVIFNTEDGNTYKYDLKGGRIWKTNTGSGIHSSPSMNDGVIIFGNDDGEIIALNPADGKLIYRNKIAKSFFCGTAVSGDFAYTGNDDGSLYAIDLKTGSIKWKYNSGSRIIMTPVVTEDNIYFGNLGGNLYCINRNDGSRVWETSTDGVLNATPYAAANLLVVPDLNHKFYFVDRKSGAVIRTYHVEGRNKLSPVIFRDLLFIGFDRGELQAYEFK